MPNKPDTTIARTFASAISICPVSGKLELEGEWFVSKKETSAFVGYTTQHLQRLEKQNLFPLRLNLGANRVAYRGSEVIAWMNARIEDRDTRLGAAEPSPPIDEPPLPFMTEQAETKTAPTVEPVAAAAGGQGGDDDEDLHNRFLTIVELAEKLNRSPQEVDWLETTQRVPVRAELPDGRVGWFLKDILAWREQRGLDVA